MHQICQVTNGCWYDNMNQPCCRHQWKLGCRDVKTAPSWKRTPWESLMLQRSSGKRAAEISPRPSRNPPPIGSGGHQGRLDASGGEVSERIVETQSSGSMWNSEMEKYIGVTKQSLKIQPRPRLFVLGCSAYGWYR